MMTRFRFLTAALLASSLLVSGCTNNKQSTSEKEELVVLCGSSFVPPADELIKDFKVEVPSDVVTSSAGSEDFLPLVKAGRKGDILITHDPYLDYVKEANAFLDSARVGFVAPVLAVAKGNPMGVKSIEDLAKSGLRVALTDPQYSTCGEMVFALLEKKGVKDAVLQNVGNRLTKGHSELGTLMQTGAVDAVIMWNGVAHNYLDHLEIVPTPYEYSTVSKHPDLVKKFVSFAQKHGEAIFASYGYVK
jgi:molybdate transport system substrate-binding protein